MRPDLCLQNAGRRHGLRGPWVLRGVDLTVAPGRLVRVEGANGSGKSTLLRLLAGIDAPSEGRITGRPRTAYVPERFPPALPFTAVGYLARLGSVHGLSRTAASRAAGEWLERLGAAAYAETPMGGEPVAARGCVAAAAGPARAHVACLLVATVGAVALGTLATLAVTLLSDPVASDHRTRVPLAAAGGAGLLATLACALLGTAVGALTSPPLLRSRGRAVLALLLAALLALVATGSPAQAAVQNLVTGSQEGTVPVPLLPLAAAALVTAAALALAGALASRRSA